MFEDNGTKNSLKRNEKRAVASKAFQAVLSKEGVTVAGEVFISEVTSPWPIWRKDRLWSIAPGRMWAMACILQSWLVSSLALLPDFLMESAIFYHSKYDQGDFFSRSVLQRAVLGANSVCQSDRC